MDENFLGEIRLFAGTFAPLGWNFCDGSSVNIADNDALFALIGTTYGGDGQVTFNLPDLRGRVPLHQGTLGGTGSVSYVLGQVGGVENVTLVASNLPVHTHALNIVNSSGTADDPANNLLGLPKTDCLLYFDGTPSVAFDPRMVGASGNSMPHSNMQPYVAMNYIIAMSGIYPSQP